METMKQQQKQPEVKCKLYQVRTDRDFYHYSTTHTGRVESTTDDEVTNDDGPSHSYEDHNSSLNMNLLGDNHNN